MNLIEAAYAAEKAAEHTDPNVLGMFGVDWSLLAAQLLNFGILLFVLHKWVYKPLLKTIDERREYIETGLRRSKEAETALREAEARQQAVLTAARKEATVIVDDAKKRGEQEKDRRLKASNELIESKLQEAKHHIALEKKATEDAVKQRIADLVVDASERVAALGLKESQQRLLIEQALQELEQTKL